MKHVIPMKNSLLLLCILNTFSVCCFAQGTEKDGDIVIRHSKDKMTDTVMFAEGNFFDWKKSKLIDTTYIENPFNGEACYYITDSILQPVAMNSYRIYAESELIPFDQFETADATLEKYILEQFIESKISKLFDWSMMRLNIDNFIIDQNGKIVFYANDGGRARERTGHALRSINYEEIIKQIIAGAPVLKPGVVNGEKVLVRLNVNLANYRIEKNGSKITYTKDNKPHEY